MASALRLRARGYDVTLLERCDQLGGRARSFEREGVKHDAGPTVITAPFLFDELFALFDRNREDYVTFVPLDPWYRFHFHDGEYFDYGGPLEKTLDEITRVNPSDRDGYLKLLEHSREIFEVGFAKLADQPFHSFGTIASQAPNLLRLGSYRSVWSMVSRYIQDERLRRAFSISPLLVGGNPYTTTSIYTLIHYLEREWGVHFALGGTRSVVHALERLMEEVGIEIRKSTTVTGFEYAGESITHVNHTGGESLPCDCVVFNGDPVTLYRDLIPPEKQRSSAKLKQRVARLSMGLFVMYFGTRQTFPNLAHHTVWMGERFRGLLHDIFHNHKLSDDFSLYIHRPTATDPSLAPEGCDSFYVLSPVPNLLGDIDWQAETARYRDKILQTLDETIMPGVKDSAFGIFSMTPEHFQHDYLSAEGAAFSIAPYFSQSAWFRFHNRAEGPRNLYLSGAGTHPGAGVPGVLSSAKLNDRLIPDPIGIRKIPA